MLGLKLNHVNKMGPNLYIIAGLFYPYMSPISASLALGQSLWLSQCQWSHTDKDMSKSICTKPQKASTSVNCLRVSLHVLYLPSYVSWESLLVYWLCVRTFDVLLKYLCNSYWSKYLPILVTRPTVLYISDQVSILSMYKSLVFCPNHVCCGSTYTSAVISLRLAC